MYVVRMTSFSVQLHTARTALRTAEKHTAPLDAELAQRLQAFNPAGYAEMEAKVAAIAATIPDLQAAYDKLNDQACHRCLGTGEYGGASRYLRNGKKFCFQCGGSGKSN